LREFEYQAGELVIGSSLPALLYARQNECPALFSSPSPPLEFQRFDTDICLSEYGVKSETKSFKSVDKVEVEGTQKLNLWSKLAFDLGIVGLTPLSVGVESMRLDKDQSLVQVFTKTRSISYHFEKLRIFDLEQISGLPTEPANEHLVVDWVNIHGGNVHNFDRLYGDSEFIKCVDFYRSHRNGTKSNDKDCVAVSYLTDTQLREVEFSDTYVRFIIRTMMERAGIKGMPNGRHWKSKKKVWLRPNPRPSKRNIYRRKVLTGELPDNIIYDSRTEEEVLKCNQQTTNTWLGLYLSQVSRLTSRL
jgi:hypothetical protein